MTKAAAVVQHVAGAQRHRTSRSRSRRRSAPEAVVPQRVERGRPAASLHQVLGGSALLQHDDHQHIQRQPGSARKSPPDSVRCFFTVQHSRKEGKSVGNTQNHFLVLEMLKYKRIKCNASVFSMVPRYLCGPDTSGDVLPSLKYFDV